MANKIIKGFTINTDDIKQAGETRDFVITADKGAVFSLQIKNEDNNYYDFNNKTFSSTPSFLKDVKVTSNSYKGSIKFPKVSDADHYDVYLFAETNYDTFHKEYNEVRFIDGSLDINSSTGSDSNLVQKIIYQTLDVTVTISSNSPGSLVLGSAGTSTITTSRNAKSSLIPFSFNFTVSGTRSLVIDRQPNQSDVFSSLQITVGSAVDIQGENIYPTLGGDPTGSGTVDGAVTSGVKVVLDQNVASVMTVGDRITGSGITGDTIKDPVTVVALNPDGDNVKEFSMSKAVALSDGVALSFFKQANHRWSLPDISKLTPGMKVTASSYFPESNVTIKDYKVINRTKNYETGGFDETVVVEIPALDTLGIQASTTRNSTTNIATTTQAGNVTFSKQAYLTYGGVAAKFYAYGTEQIKTATGYDVEFSDLEVALTEISTTTTSAPSNATSWNIASAVGIVENVSTVSGIGIDASAVDPTVTTITNVGGATWDNSGAATITVSAAQTLENGIGLKFAGASNVITISGNIKFNKVGNEDITFSFDLEKFITMTAAP